MENPANNFFNLAEKNPCTGCSAPCCRMVLIPHAAPANYMDLDYILYMLGFPSIEMVLNINGQWQVMVSQNCSFFDEQSHKCTIYNTSRKPKTCTYFNPYRCWYKRNFSEQAAPPPEVVRLDMASFEKLLSYVQFDENDNISKIPSWETIKEIVEEFKAPSPG